MARKPGSASKRRRDAAAAKLPAGVRSFVDRRVRTGGFADTSDYLGHLVEEDRRRVEAERRRLVQMVREGLESGPGVEATDAWWATKKAELLARHRPLRKTG